MADVYTQLAKKLDRMPQGFPATSSGVELKILRKIFDPEDAKTALKLRPVPSTAEEIARRLRRPTEEMQRILDRMAAKGQIGSFRMDGLQKYAFMPFVIGIYEFQLQRLDMEFAALLEEYAPTLFGALGGRKPALARVVPVNASVDARAEILDYEDMRGLIRRSRSFVLRDCICRKERALLGRPCRHPLETCMAFSEEENAHEYFNYAGRTITRDQALRHLDEFEGIGLVHATYNVRTSPVFVCNCCACCCGFLRGLIEFHAPHMIARSNFAASIDLETCNACGVCASDRCPVQAIHSGDGGYAVDPERCIGCGICSPACPTDSIRLRRRPPSAQAVPEKDLLHWHVARASGRSGPLTRLALRAWLARHG